MSLAKANPPAQPPAARATWPLPEPTLTYFPNARFALSEPAERHDRLAAGERLS